MEKMATRDVLKERLPGGFSHNGKPVVHFPKGYNSRNICVVPSCASLKFRLLRTSPRFEGSRDDSTLLKFLASLNVP